MRVVRIYHGGRSRGHRARERALVSAGVDVTLVVPDHWAEGGGEEHLSDEPFEVIPLPVVRSGDVNRHRYADPASVADVVRQLRPDVADVHEEPFSAVVHQLLPLLPPGAPVVTYTAQNIDKRYPPPFTRWERQAYARVTGIYPCSRQAASFVRGRGFPGLVEVVPLGYDDALFQPGSQRHDDDVFVVSFAGRLVVEKGVRDTVAAFAAVRRVRPARLVICGDGPEGAHLDRYLREAAVPDAEVERLPWADVGIVADVYRRSHLMLCPSTSTDRWTEQFGRMIPEAQAAGAVVVTYACGTLPEAAGGGACISAEGDVAGLSRMAADLARDGGGWTAMREAGFQAAADKTWAAVADRQVAFYEQVVATGAPALRAVHPQRKRGAAEFGETALNSRLRRRPFALPVLRRL